MVKGVHQNIIEISDTGDAFFERAILFVRLDKAAQDEKSLHAKARAYLQRLSLRRGMLRRGRLWRTVLKFASGAVAGAVITALLLNLG